MKSQGSADRTGLWPRRRVLKALSVAGAGSAVFGRALTALAADKPKVTRSMVRQAEWIAGVHYSDADRDLMLAGVNEAIEDYAKMRAVPIDNAIPPAVRFDPTAVLADPGAAAPPAVTPGPAPDLYTGKPAARPASDDDLAFLSVAHLAPMIRSRAISSTELTKLYLARIKRLDPTLLCIVTLTEELALTQAAAADAEIAAGIHRGPLHGIPWGAKDLLSIQEYRTTWGSVPFKEQKRAETATVAARLAAAGAVLLAKTSVGELAWGDVWFGGTTKNPWKIDQGSSGSSAGSASATAAGLAGFCIGTETWGSIVSPGTRCGATGLRPTFGRISRHGVMALSWSMDKVGPLARSVEDCALVFAAIHGADGKDGCAVDRPFDWPARRRPQDLRIGYVPELFERDRTKFAESEKDKAGLREWSEFDNRTLQELRGLGFNLKPIALPSAFPIGPLSTILSAEAACAFDELTRTGRDDLMVRQVVDAWPNVFRQGQLIPAVEYLRANRLRTMLMRQMEETMRDVDVYVVPSFGGDNLLMTNLTGHPAVVAPNGFSTAEGTPTSITFQGRLYGETDLLAVARAWQESTGYHLKRPPLKG